MKQKPSYLPKKYKYSARSGNLKAEAVGVVKGEKHFPVFEGDVVFKPLTKSKPLSTPLFAYAEVFWSWVIDAYFMPAPQYQLAFCEGYEAEVEKYYDYGTVSPMIYGEGEHLLNLLEFFRKYPDDKVHIDDYVNYCQMFYDYTEFLESDYFQTHPAMAEELVLHTMTNGAAQDIQDATGIARNMVAMFGMSDEFGMMALASRRSQYLDGGYGLDCAQDTAAAMDKAVKDILDKCYADAVNIIRENRADMDKVVAYLLEKETITGAEMVAIIEGRDPSTVEDAYASTLAHENGFRPSQPEVIEPAARKVHMISEKIEAPENAPADGETNNEDKPSSDEAPSDGKPESKQENDTKSE